MDEGYKNLINIIIKLNNDRYKSYFNYFIIMNLGTLTAIGSDFSKEVSNLRLFLSMIGIILSISWLLVLYKVQKDIHLSWKKIEDYEKSDQYKDIRIHETLWKGFSASKIMLVIPACFLATNIFLFYMNYDTKKILFVIPIILFAIYIFKLSMSYGNDHVS
jgi:hypothetical protein